MNPNYTSYSGSGSGSGFNADPPLTIAPPAPKSCNDKKPVDDKTVKCYLWFGVAAALIITALLINTYYHLVKPDYRQTQLAVMMACADTSTKGYLCFTDSNWNYINNSISKKAAEFIKTQDAAKRAVPANTDTVPTSGTTGAKAATATVLVAPTGTTGNKLPTGAAKISGGTGGVAPTTGNTPNPDAAAHKTDAGTKNSANVAVKATLKYRYQVPAMTFNNYMLFTRKGMDNQTRMLLLIALCGALGAMVYSLSSFTNFRGSNTLYESWLPFYLVKPVIGMGLALGFNFLFGSTKFSTTVGGSIDPSDHFGLFALAFMVGLCTDKAMQKLSDVFAALLAPTNPDAKRPDALSDKPTPSVESLEPKVITPGVRTGFAIKGSGFSSALVVKCDGVLVDTADMVMRDSCNVQFYHLTTKAPKDTVTVALTDPAATGNDVYMAVVTVIG